MSIKVTIGLADVIQAAVYRQKIKPAEDELKAEYKDITQAVFDRYIEPHMAVFDRYIEPHMALIKRLPNEMIRWQVWTYVRLPGGKGNTELHFSQSIPNLDELGDVFVKHVDLGKRMEAYLDNLAALSRRRETLKRDTITFVRQFSTVKKLMLAWPEVKELVPEIAVEESDCKALAIRAEDFKAMLAAA